jgi:adenylosuccinate lyase
MATAYVVIAIKSTVRGLGKLQADSAVIADDLESAWAVIGEAVQTVMRRYGIPEPYEKLKALTRGQAVDRELIQQFVESLEIPDAAKEHLLQLTPATYTGLAESLAVKKD